MKNKFLLSLLVFSAVFCTPVMIAKSFEVYAELGGKLGVIIYDATHEDNL